MLTSAILCLAMNVYQESRGEPLEGQLAVAYVTHHRANHDPKKYCSVVYAKGQFSWTENPAEVDKKSVAWQNAVALAKTFRHFHDPTKGATYFHATSHKPRWAKGKRLTAHIGSHKFYKEV